MSDMIDHHERYGSGDVPTPLRSVTSDRLYVQKLNRSDEEMRYERSLGDTESDGD